MAFSVGNGFNVVKTQPQGFELESSPGLPPLVPPATSSGAQNFWGDMLAANRWLRQNFTGVIGPRDSEELGQLKPKAEQARSEHTKSEVTKTEETTSDAGAKPDTSSPFDTLAACCAPNSSRRRSARRRPARPGRLAFQARCTRPWTAPAARTCALCSPRLP